jgi:hypothetical protein
MLAQSSELPEQRAPYVLTHPRALTKSTVYYFETYVAIINGQVVDSIWHPEMKTKGMSLRKRSVNLTIFRGAKVRGFLHPWIN